LFIFQEGQDPAVTRTFKTMAKLSGGAFAPFNLNSSSQLKRLLAGVAAYATGGRSALDALARQQSELKVLLQQLPPA
ncbi:MAG: VWA domain-containing protein, partial [Pseudomonadales bacterium]